MTLIPPEPLEKGMLAYSLYSETEMGYDLSPSCSICELEDDEGYGMHRLYLGDLILRLCSRHWAWVHAGVEEVTERNPPMGAENEDVREMAEAIREYLEQQQEEPLSDELISDIRQTIEENPSTCNFRHEARLLLEEVERLRGLDNE